MPLLFGIFSKKFMKEMETMKNFTGMAERKFEDLENAFLSLSRKNPPSRRDNNKKKISCTNEGQKSNKYCAKN